MAGVSKDRKGCTVGAIIALPFGRYMVSVRAKLYGYQEDVGIVQKSFDRLDEALNWLSKVLAEA